MDGGDQHRIGCVVRNPPSHVLRRTWDGAAIEITDRYEAIRTSFRTGDPGAASAAAAFLVGLDRTLEDMRTSVSYNISRYVNAAIYEAVVFQYLRLQRHAMARCLLRALLVRTAASQHPFHRTVLRPFVDDYNGLCVRARALPAALHHYDDDDDDSTTTTSLPTDAENLARHIIAAASTLGEGEGDGDGMTVVIRWWCRDHHHHHRRQHYSAPPFGCCTHSSVIYTTTWCCIGTTGTPTVGDGDGHHRRRRVRSGWSTSTL